MRTMIDEEEENDSAITLNTATLLGIFFGLVLVCGVFFGFGYSVGRRGNDASAASNTASASSASSSKESNPAPVTEPSTPKPSAMQSLQTASESENTVTQSLDNPPAHHAAAAASAPARPTPAAAPETVRNATTPAKPALVPASLPTPVAGSGSIMVQIAAVSHQEDADALVSALRRHGYSVSARNEPQDKLLHVQVGPFASRDAAKAMRAKLQADGYNAILK